MYIYTFLSKMCTSGAIIIIIIIVSNPPQKIIINHQPDPPRPTDRPTDRTTTMANTTNAAKRPTDNGERQHSRRADASSPPPFIFTNKLLLLHPPSPCTNARRGMGKYVFFSLIVHIEINNNYGCRCNSPLHNRFSMIAMQKSQCRMGKKTSFWLIVLLFWFSLLQTLTKIHGSLCNSPPSQQVKHDCSRLRKDSQLPAITAASALLWGRWILFQTFEFSKNGISENYNTPSQLKNARRHKMCKRVVSCWFLCTDSFFAIYANANHHYFHSYIFSRPS